MPRTEQEILNDFEKFGWKIYLNDDIDLILLDFAISKIHIWKSKQAFLIPHFVDIQVHKLLHELFTVWGWLDE